MKKFLIICVSTIFFFDLAFGQEKKDSLTIHDGPKQIQNEHLNFDHSFDLFYPLSSPMVKDQQMLNQVFEYNDATSKQFQYLVSPYNAFYYYSNNGFRFYQNSVPLVVGFSYHSNEAFYSKKIDLFVDGSGLLYNDYFPTDPNVIPGDKKAFIWELGIGAGYKINSKSTIFIKGSVLMNNMNPYGTKELGGMNVKF